MSRPSLGHSLVTRMQYLSVLSMKIPGEAAWTVIGQGRAFSPAPKGSVREFRRLGDKVVTRMASSIVIDVSFQVYVENTLDEVARALGVPMPQGGWAGTEEIQFDPTFVADYKIDNYDSPEADATFLFTEYINEFRAENFGMPLDAEGDSARIAEMSGSAIAYYITPADGLGAA